MSLGEVLFEIQIISITINFFSPFTAIIKDDNDTIIERAIAYEIPKKEVRSFHYACSAVFGKKLPVFSEEQLALCDDKTLLLLKNKETDPEDEGFVMLLHSIDADGKLNVSLNYDDGETKQFFKEELFNYKDGQYDIYYFLDSPVTKEDQKSFVSEVLKEKAKQVQKKGTKTIIKKGIKAGVRDSITEGLKGAVAGKLIAPKVAKVAGKTASGPLLDVGLGTVEAGVATYQSRKKEKKYEESGGVTGFSRTRANKEIASNWSSAAAGTAGGMGSAALLTTGAAIAGQVKD